MQLIYLDKNIAKEKSLLPMLVHEKSLKLCIVMVESKSFKLIGIKNLRCSLLVKPRTKFGYDTPKAVPDSERLVKKLKSGSTAVTERIKEGADFDINIAIDLLLMRFIAML